MSIKIPEQNFDQLNVYSKNNTVFFKGEIILMHPETVLKPILDIIKKQMSDEVIIDISNLNFINSSGIGCFVDFILDIEQDKKIYIKTDFNKPFQEKAWNIFKALNEEKVILR